MGKLEQSGAGGKPVSSIPSLETDPVERHYPKIIRRSIESADRTESTCGTHTEGAEEEER